MARIPTESIQSRKGLSFPDMELIPTSKKKTPSYCKQVSEAIYSSYVNNKTELSGTGLDTYFDTLRIFAKGKQSPDQYKKYFNAAGSAGSLETLTDIDTTFAGSHDANRKGWLTTIWKTVSPIPNMKTMAKSKALPQDFDVKVNCVDVDAGNDESYRMNREWVKANPKTKGMLDIIGGAAKIPSVENEPMTDSYADLMEIKKEGGFKAQHILAIEQALLHTENISYWDRELKEKIFDDLFDLSYAFAYPKYNKANCKIHWEYLDPKDTIIQYSKVKGFRNPQYFSRFEYMDINDIRTFQDKITNGEKTGLNKDDFTKIGKLYAEYENNPSEAEWNNFGSKLSATSTMPKSKVCVLHSYWKDVEKENKSEYTNKYGKKKRVEYKKGQEKNDKYNTWETRVKMVYQCSWIVGTDYVWDYGVMHNQIRLDAREPMLPVAGFKLEEKSYVDRLIPVAHMFAISFLRFINNIAKAQSDFYAIDYDRLAEISDGDKKYKPLDIIRMMREENIFLYIGGATPMGGGNVPVAKVAGTLMEDISKELSIMEALLRQAEILTGLSPVSLGATPSEEAPVGTTELSLSATHSALGVLNYGVMNLKASLGELTVPMFINSIKGTERSRREWSRVIGKDDVKNILESKNAFIEYGMSLSPRPTDEQKAILLELAAKSMEKRNQGMGGINEGQYIWMMNILSSGGNFTEVANKFKYWIRKDEQRIFKEKQTLIDQQAQRNAEMEKQKADKEMMTNSMKVKGDLSKVNAEKEGEMIVDNNNTINQIKILQAQAKINKGVTADEVISP